MKRVLDPIRVEFIDGRRWRLLDTFRYHVGDPKSREIVIVPRGFLTDFASIPRILWNILPPTGPYAPAALVHDYLYYSAVVFEMDLNRSLDVDRAFSDAVFEEAMGVVGVKPWKQYAMYAGVRVGGRRAWNKHREREKVAA